MEAIRSTAINVFDPASKFGLTGIGLWRELYDKAAPHVWDYRQVAKETRERLVNFW